MLSATNTINDVKSKLVRTYSQYGYSAALDFESAIEDISVEVYLESLLPILGESFYGDIQAKDKTDLEDNETYVYWAEVFFIASSFLSMKSHSKVQTVSGDSQSINTEGYSQSTTGAKNPGYNDIALEFYNKGRKYMALGGFQLNNRMKRGGSSFTQDVNRTEFYE